MHDEAAFCHDSDAEMTPVETDPLTHSDQAVAADLGLRLVPTVAVVADLDVENTRPVVLVGVTMSAGEFRHNTATPTFLITPDRRRVMTAKFLAGGILGIVLAVVSAVVTVAVAAPWLHARNIDVNLWSFDVITPIAGALLSISLGVIFGVGVGGMIHNQTVAVTVIVVWTSIIEAFLTGFVPEVGRWLPSGAASALGGTWTSEGGLLPFWAAALVLIGYCAAAASAGTHLIARKDLT